MIEVIIFKTPKSYDCSELVAIIPFDSFTGWFKEYEFDLTCCYQLHFVKDGKIIKDL